MLKFVENPAELSIAIFCFYLFDLISEVYPVTQSQLLKNIMAVMTTCVLCDKAEGRLIWS